MKPKNAAGPIIGFTILLSLFYAMLRYHILGPVPWKDFPFFILNKGVKVSEGWLNSRKALGMTGFLLVLIHALMSFLLFNPAVYGAFFEPDGTLTSLGGLSMLGGVISFVVLWAYNLSFQTFLREDQAFIRFITSRKFLLIAMLFAAIHLFFMGYKGWMNPSGWHGGLPPISLVGFTFFSIGYVINLLGRK
ncbi:MAG: hypothetical protein P8X60_11135 [Robiginitalea sp.]